MDLVDGEIKTAMDQGQLQLKLGEYQNCINVTSAMRTSACLTVQSTQVRSSLLGPLEAGGREG